ncbi:16S rRNA (uracil(1498)-N(3))-methyltransferase [Oceanobacter mangrovi]|uniref:16S rRNA (uracil(1498)-N(3))-methyltransferase n=1 Tax=Oceanobacter mangrovi TaxID=2862510 RepID=UPI001C8DBCDF|nr:16S rRNA (uracil(1498)-N(3))-methyltransferase [Oceanobacter mangrovi]
MAPRIYTPETLVTHQQLELEEQASIHLLRVLRMAAGDPIRLFNGDGNEYLASITEAGKKRAMVTVESINSTDNELALPIHLGQVISKGDKMDFTIQKATELGVSQITPLISERCDVRLKGERMDKKLEHWRKVAISACEQCGRNRIPEILPVMTLNDWYSQLQAELKLILHPHNQQPLAQQSQPTSVALLVGPEGGFTEVEVAQAQQAGFNGLILGPRILRTETAALAAVSVLQYVWGDF